MELGESESESKLRAVGFGRLRVEDMAGGWWAGGRWWDREERGGWRAKVESGTCRGKYLTEEPNALEFVVIIKPTAGFHDIPSKAGLFNGYNSSISRACMYKRTTSV